jgi:ketosteroid isomerase-like protein
VLQGGDKRAIAAAVDSAMHAYLDAVAARDADGVIAHYADDPEFLVFFDATPYDYAAMVSTVRDMFGGLSAVDVEPVTVQITVLGRDAAIAGFTFRETFTDTAQRVTPLHGTASWTWRRHGNGWTIIHGDAVHLPDTPSASP